MSDSCRCDDIKHYQDEKSKLRLIKSGVCFNYSMITKIVESLANIANLEMEAYESCYKADVANAVRHLGDDLEPLSRKIECKVNDEMGRIEKILKDLKREDHEYHEAERRSRERAAKEKQEKDNAAKANRA